MRQLDLTLTTPAENLALDEALLDEAEASPVVVETLRFWESTAPLVVVGRSSQLAHEVHEDDCLELGIPVLRRTSGGAAIVAGPGCLMYALVLSYEARPELRSLDKAHEFVLSTIASAIKQHVPSITRQGTSDLAIGRLKCSGNSVRCKRRTFLYHGTLLYDFDLSLIARCLQMPPRVPAYRQGRSHEEFVANLPLDAVTLRKTVSRAWNANPSNVDWPRDRVVELVASRYGRADWNRGH